jgi:hypothetical protein
VICFTFARFLCPQLCHRQTVLKIPPAERDAADVAVLGRPPFTFLRHAMLRPRTERKLLANTINSAPVDSSSPQLVSRVINGGTSALSRNNSAHTPDREGPRGWRRLCLIINCCHERLDTHGTPAELPRAGAPDGGAVPRGVIAAAEWQHVVPIESEPFLNGRHVRPWVQVPGVRLCRKPVWRLGAMCSLTSVGGERQGKSRDKAVKARARRAGLTQDAPD